MTYSKSPFPRWLPWPRREGDPHSNHLTVPHLPTGGLTRGHAMACANTRCPPEPAREALTDSWELGEGTWSPRSPSKRTLGANLLGDGGMVVLQDESLDVVSPAPFLLHCLGLGRHKEKEQGLLFQVKTA